MPTPFHRRFRGARADYDAAIARMIERRREGGGDDLLAALVAARDEKTGQGLSDGEIRDEATTLFFLWKPVAITLAWVWWLLGQNAAAADRLRAEVSTVLDGPPSLDDVERLPYVRAVVDEALRLYPPGLLQPREAFADDELRGSPVPAGTRVVMCPYVTHRHPEFWEDAEAFDPERFLGARELPPFAFSPLGEPGPRRCLGYHIARLELPLVVATIARRCRLRPVPGQSVATSMGVAMDFARPLLMEHGPV